MPKTTVPPLSNKEPQLHEGPNPHERPSTPIETLQENTPSPKQGIKEVREKIGKTLEFARRHIGPSEGEISEMLGFLGFESLEDLMDAAIPEQIRSAEPLSLPPALSETAALEELSLIASRNQEMRSHIGTGYSETLTPTVIQRNIMEDPGWLTAYTPYQAEISQGRLEALLNFQTMVAELSGMEVANASLLDEGTAAAEAMTMAHRIGKGKRNVLLVANDCHPQTIEVIKTRARPLGIEIVEQDPQEFDPSENTCGILLQYPNTDGTVQDYEDICKKAQDNGALSIVATDPLALATLRPPGEFGADIAFGSTQRFGAPMGFGGPHAAFFATKKKHVRQMPGRIVGASKDPHGNTALRLALGTREQHIRREKATSNICTSQVLLAITASMYGVYHGPDGLKEIADRIHQMAETLATGLKQLDYAIPETTIFDTIKIPVSPEQQRAILAQANKQQINLRVFDNALGISLDEKTSPNDVQDLLNVFALNGQAPDAQSLLDTTDGSYDESIARTSQFMTHPVFNSHHSEMDMTRYITKLKEMDISLTRSMIPLGSCTMKLSGTSTMLPISWSKFGNMHPFAPRGQTEGYQEMIEDLEHWLAEITGLEAVSLQPNAGSQGEYAGLLVIRKYHEDRGEDHRNICLIPHSAHGTNPASATMAGMKTIEVDCDEQGNIDIEDLKAKAKEHSANLAALMVTYPSTHGVFEEGIEGICDAIHTNGGQVYMDGANMNAQTGYCRPGEYGADVLHLNLHKTFGLPHGGGGPGVGPIAVAKHLSKHLPNHPIVKTSGEKGIGPVSAAPWGSASILPIAWMYIRMMGADGLKRATATAVLNANYIAKKLAPYFPTLYTNQEGLVAHECIIDPRSLQATTDVTAEDIAKRLADFGWHAPTLSFPVPGTLMVEPTESESMAHIDLFIEAMIAIHGEIKAVEDGHFSKDDNPLTNAPHTAAHLLTDEWTHPYSREQAAFPADWVKKEGKYWPPVGRVNATHGDRNPKLTLSEEEN
jgi:glycine dehydrogenase